MNPQRLSPHVFRYRVKLGEGILGHFTNIKLAVEAARGQRRAIVLDVSVQPPKVVYKDGKFNVEDGEK